jgi:hypothetical protein
MANLHPPILDALRTREPQRVVQALRRHFQDAGSHLAGAWENKPLAATPGASGKGAADPDARRRGDPRRG